VRVRRPDVHHARRRQPPPAPAVRPREPHDAEEVVILRVSICCRTGATGES
jgi:hypothetical protein